MVAKLRLLLIQVIFILGNTVTRNVYSYNLTGTLIQTLPLDSGDNGISLSIANGYLFVSKDANYAIGTWI